MFPRIYGQFSLNRRLSPEHHKYLQRFTEVYHCRWNTDLLESMGEPDPIREAVGLPLGHEGMYFTGDRVHLDYADATSEPPALMNPNRPPEGMPGWDAIPNCPWVPTPDGTVIRWNDSEYVNDYAEWLQFLLDHFLIPWGYVLNGSASWLDDYDWQGRSPHVGLIVVVDNEVKQITWEEVWTHWREIMGLLHPPES